MKTEGVFIRLDIISDYFNIDVTELTNVVKGKDTINFRLNTFIYRNNYYITIEHIFYIIYKHYYTFIDRSIFDKMSKYYNTPSILIIDMYSKTTIYNDQIKYKNSILQFSDPDNAGYVYLAISGEFVKIGVTTNPARRCYGIKNGSKQVYVDNYIEMNTLLFKPTFLKARKLEVKLHRDFKNYKYKGEWYNDVDYINEVVHREYAEFILI